MALHNNLAAHIKTVIRKGWLKRGFSWRNLFQAYRLMRKAIRNENRRLTNKIRFNTEIPAVCIFSVTWDCNLRCEGCYAMNYRHQDQLNPAQVSLAIDKLMELGTYMFVIAGGEPLMVPGLIDILGSHRDGIFFLFTNATLLTQERIGQLKRYQNILPVISIEGEPADTDARRGSGVAEKVGQAFSLLKQHGLIFGFSTMATHLNVSYVTSRDYMVKMADQGAVYAFIIDYIPFEFSLKPEYVLTVSDNQFKQRELNARRHDTPLLVMNFPSDEYKDNTCKSAGRGLIHINANGWVEPCPFSHYSAHHILRDEYRDVLNSEFFIRIRKQFVSTQHHGECMLMKHRDQVIEIVNQTGAFSTEKS